MVLHAGLVLSGRNGEATSLHHSAHLLKVAASPVGIPAVCVAGRGLMLTLGLCLAGEGCILCSGFCKVARSRRSSREDCQCTHPGAAAGRLG